MKLLQTAFKGVEDNLNVFGYTLPVILVQSVEGKLYIVGIADIYDLDGTTLRDMLQTIIEGYSGVAYALVLPTYKGESVVSYQNMLTRESQAWIGPPWLEINNSNGPLDRLFDNPGDVLL